MSRLFSLLAICCLLTSCAADRDAVEQQTSAPPRSLAAQDAERLRSRLDRETVEQMGEQRSFAAFELILANPTRPGGIGDPAEIIRQVFHLLHRSMTGDRSRFRPAALAALKHENPFVRSEAVHLLRRIGSVDDAPALLALLADEDCFVVFLASRTLSEFGGPNDLVAMDAWLRGPGQASKFSEYVEENRDRLVERLAKEAASTPKVK